MAEVDGSTANSSDRGHFAGIGDARILLDLVDGEGRDNRRYLHAVEFELSLPGASVSWLLRLLREPRRCWHRSMVYGPQFALHTILQLSALRRYDHNRRGGEKSLPASRHLRQMRRFLHHAYNQPVGDDITQKVQNQGPKCGVLAHPRRLPRRPLVVDFGAASSPVDDMSHVALPSSHYTS